MKKKVKGCEICGGRLCMIRGRYPEDNKREVCPTCLQEKLEYINDILSNRGFISTNQKKK